MENRTSDREREQDAIAPLVVISGFAFLDAPGIALQLRKAALCVRFADGNERHFQAGEHTIKTIIIAASASITTEALRWCAVERVSVLIMHRNGECFSIFADGPGHKHARKELLLRRRQFEASRVTIAVAIVAMKIKALGLSRETQAVLLRKLARAKLFNMCSPPRQKRPACIGECERGFLFRSRVMCRKAGAFSKSGWSRGAAGDLARKALCSVHATLCIP